MAAIMEQEKPFKTIEVIDNDTRQVCKVACMSCIRGHRTTSCGIPVCRTKIFWTVKRPGRPSNSCTCRFHSSGVCKCVTAIPKCPHKSRKGEKRSSECRCDEQGRFCCLLEPEHWRKLMALEKPTVQFYPSRETLEAWQASQSGGLQTPAPSVYEPAPRQASCCGSTTTQSTPRMSRSIAPSPPDATTTPQSSIIVPRFGFMGIGAPMGPNHETPDVMAWNGMAPSLDQQDPEEAVSSCCGGGSSYTPPVAQDFPGQPYEAYQYPAAPTGFDFDRWNQNYQLYQMPNAICQHCGLNGCTCRSCPPLMQNFGTTSWAHSCGRRHARIAPMPAAQAPQQMQQGTAHMENGASQHVPAADAPMLGAGILPSMQSVLARSASSNGASPPGPTSPPHIQQDMHPPPLQYSQSQDIPQHMQALEAHLSPLLQPGLNGYDDHHMLGEPPDNLDYNDFIIPELERPQHIIDQHMYEG